MKIKKDDVIIALLAMITIVALVSVATGNFALPSNGKWLLGIPAKWSITCWPL